MGGTVADTVILSDSGEAKAVAGVFSDANTNSKIPKKPPKTHIHYQSSNHRIIRLHSGG